MLFFFLFNYSWFLNIVKLCLDIVSYQHEFCSNWVYTLSLLIFMCGVLDTYITHILKFSCIYTGFGSYLSKNTVFGFFSLYSNYIMCYPCLVMYYKLRVTAESLCWSMIVASIWLGADGILYDVILTKFLVIDVYCLRLPDMFHVIEWIFLV